MQNMLVFLNLNIVYRKISYVHVKYKRGKPNLLKSPYDFRIGNWFYFIFQIGKFIYTNLFCKHQVETRTIK